jgi:hypothetical protein
MVDPQHDGDHRAHVGLVVDDENAGHGGCRMGLSQPTSEPEIWRKRRSISRGILPAQ